MSGRACTAEEVAQLICFLASDAAPYINGQEIFIDGADSISARVFGFVTDEQ